MSSRPGEAARRPSRTRSTRRWASTSAWSSSPWTALVRAKLPLCATRGTQEFLASNGVDAELLGWPLDDDHPNALEVIESGKVDLVINVPKSFEKEELTNDYLIRRKAVDFDVSLFTNIQAAVLFVEALSILDVPRDLLAKSWAEYK